MASLAIPRMDKDLRREAKDHIISALKYTQHMALVDDKRDPFDPTWQLKLWKMSFAADGSSYSISSGNNFAVDSTDGKLIDATATGSKSSRIGKKYGIDGITRSGGCGGTLIAFDNLGRPFGAIAAGIGVGSSDYANYMVGDCRFTMSFASSGIDDLVITITEETGHISGN